MESFDTVSNFMINPEHSEKTYEEIFKEFKKSGGKNIGYGAFGLVYYHPKWPYVLKTFKSDDAYLKFVRYAYDNPHPSFPKFYGKPQRVSPKIQSINDKRYLVRIEKLKPISKKAFDKIDFRLVDFFKLIHNPDDVSEKEQYKLLNMQSDIGELSKSVYRLLEGLYLIRSNLGLQEDLHDGNVMVRNDGQFVWADPVMESGGIMERENSLMIPETFHILYQIINKINRKFKNAEVELIRDDDNFFDIHLSMTLDISKCGIKDINILLDNEEEIKELFKDGGDLYFSVDDIQFTTNNIKVDLIVANMGNMSNVKDGVEYLGYMPDYLNWMNQEFQSELCDILSETTDSIQESTHFDREYRRLIEAYEKDVSKFHNFFEELAQYQSNHYGVYDSSRLRDEYLKLPEDFKRIMRLPKSRYKNCYRGDDGRNEKPVLSFVYHEDPETAKSNASFYGRQIISLRVDIKSLLDTMYFSFDRIARYFGQKISWKIMDEYGLGDGENEVLVFDVVFRKRARFDEEYQKILSNFK